MGAAADRIGGFLERHDRHILIAGIALVVVFGVLYSIHLGDRMRFAFYEPRYLLQARYLASLHRFTSNGVNPEVYFPPGYAFLLALVATFSRAVAGFRILNYLLLAATLWMVHRILKSRVGGAAGALGVILVLCYPVLAYAAGLIVPQTLAALLFLVVLHLLTRGDLSVAGMAGAGAAYGYLMLVVPTFSFTVPFFAAAAALRGGLRHRWRFLAAILLACVVVGGWCARNWLVFGKFVYISSNSGRMLLLGNSENSTAESGADTDVTRYVREAQRTCRDQADEGRFFAAAALHWARTHPGAAARLYVQKLAHNFTWRNELSTRGEGSRARDLVMLLTYGSLVLLLALRLARWRRFPLDAFELLALALYLGYALVAAAFFPRIRYRLPFDYLLILVAAGFLGRWIEAARLRRSRRGPARTARGPVPPGAPGSASRSPGSPARR